MRGVSGWHIQVAIHSRDSIDHMAKQSVAKKAEIYRVLIYQLLLVCVSLCIDSHFHKRNTVSHKIVNIYLSAFPINKYKEKQLWFYITFADISCIYVMAHRCVSGPKKVDLQSSFQSHAMRFHRSLSRAHPTPTPDHFISPSSTRPLYDSMRFELII